MAWNLTTLGFAAYGLAALFFLLFFALLLTSWRGRLQGGLLLMVSLVSVAWAMAAALQARFGFVPGYLLWSMESLRILFILVFLIRLLELQAEGKAGRKLVLSRIRFAVIVLCVVMLIPFEAWLPHLPFVDEIRVPDLRFVLHALLSVFGLVLIEQLYRNTPLELRWGIKFLCLGFGALLAFDFYLFSDAMLFNRLDGEIWQARGVVNCLAVPFIGISAARNPQWSLDLFVSRKIVFHTTAIFAAGIYLLMMALAGYYIRIYGGEWSRVLEIVFFAGAVLVLLVLLFSGQIRARLKVFVSKNFFSYKYDYREEWLRLIATLSGREGIEGPLTLRVIYSLCELVDSPGGALWLDRKQEGFCFTMHWNQSAALLERERDIGSLPSYFRAAEWVVNLDEYRADPDFYEGLDLPDWMLQVGAFWLIVPLFHERELLGFVALEKSRAPHKLDWETLDLLKTAGRQAASYLALEQAADALAEARQFEGFNRLSAFVMHDLKNLIAQLSLVARNAEKHKHNPDFIDDAVLTIQNSVSKMNHLMAQLRGAVPEARSNKVDLVELVSGVVTERARQLPSPKFVRDDRQVHLFVFADKHRLASVIGHVVQNAQEATGAKGRVEVRLEPLEQTARVTVRDDGVGMDQDFIKNRLFKPFDSTKGLTGMGVGAYECKEFVTAMGGRIEVESTPGEGTLFSIYLPVQLEEAEAEVAN